MCSQCKFYPRGYSFISFCKKLCNQNHFLKMVEGMHFSKYALEDKAAVQFSMYCLFIAYLSPQWEPQSYLCHSLLFHFTLIQPYEINLDRWFAKGHPASFHNRVGNLVQWSNHYTILSLTVRSRILLWIFFQLLNLNPFWACSSFYFITSFSFQRWSNWQPSVQLYEHYLWLCV